MKFTKILLFILLFVGLSACSMKAPEDSHAEKADEAISAMAEAKDNLNDATAEAAKLREEAAQLRTSGTSEDEAKAVQLEQKAARLETDALNQLNPGLH